MPQGTILGGRELIAFRTQKAHIDGLIGKAADKPDAPVADLASLQLRGRQTVGGSGKGR